MQHFDYTEFRGEVKKQIVVQNLGNYTSIAKLSGLNLHTIRAFMTGVRSSPNTALKLKKALNIKQKYGFEMFAKTGKEFV